MRSSVKGFTLLELAIVLLILGLLLASLLVPLATQHEAGRIKNTTEQLKEIRQALYGFVLKEGRLPCPDTNNNGQEGPGACEQGTLPNLVLGLKGEDAWGNRFTYRVTEAFADSDDGTGCEASPYYLAPGVSFTLCSEGDIRVEDGEGNAVAEKIPAIVVSHGERAVIGVDPEPSDYEEGNLDNDTPPIFVDRDYSSVEDEEFDDLLIWIPHHVLHARMLEAGMLP